jgi:hypothetical protein
VNEVNTVEGVFNDLFNPIYDLRPHVKCTVQYSESASVCVVSVCVCGCV